MLSGVLTDGVLFLLHVQHLLADCHALYQQCLGPQRNLSLGTCLSSSNVLEHSGIKPNFIAFLANHCSVI